MTLRSKDEEKKHYREYSSAERLMILAHEVQKNVNSIASIAAYLRDIDQLEIQDLPSDFGEYIQQLTRAVKDLQDAVEIFTSPD